MVHVMKKKQEPIGFHNQRLADMPAVITGHSYRKVSTVIFVPTLGSIPSEVVSSWIGLMRPMNQFTVGPIFLKTMEVGEAYEHMVTIVRSNPDLRKFKYVLTLEEDNIVPVDALLKLQEDIETGPWDAVGGLYFTKGEGGKPMCYGRVDVDPVDFIPWLPPVDVVAPCRGLGMGCTLFRMSMLLDERFQRPIFKTVQQFTPGKGVELYTQDLRAFQSAGELGYRFAASTRCLVGHLDVASGIVW